jgi:hypothetical protein
MGYFDAVTSRSFKTTTDGRKVFFPWGAWGRGYAIASERDYRRLHQQLKFQWVSMFLFSGLVSLVFINGSASLKGYVILAFPILLALFVSFHMMWLRYWLPRLQPSDERYERLSLQEGMTFTACALPAVVLWFSEIVSLAFVSAGILVFILGRGSWILALALVPILLSALFFCIPACFEAALRENPILVRKPPGSSRSNATVTHFSPTAGISR